MNKLKYEVRGLGKEFGCGDVFKTFKVEFDQPVNTEWLENVINKGVDIVSQQAAKPDCEKTGDK
uniref:Uncharacterized protein n=1 Tax=viral metagenome TaxID=1070528 RepID=A0A6M3LES4_9ZZZZ